MGWRSSKRRESITSDADSFSTAQSDDDQSETSPETSNSSRWYSRAWSKVRHKKSAPASETDLDTGESGVGLGEAAQLNDLEEIMLRGVRRRAQEERKKSAPEQSSSPPTSKIDLEKIAAKLSKEERKYLVAPPPPPPPEVTTIPSEYEPHPDLYGLATQPSSFRGRSRSSRRSTPSDSPYTETPSRRYQSKQSTPFTSQESLRSTRGPSRATEQTRRSRSRDRSRDNYHRSEGDDRRSGNPYGGSYSRQRSPGRVATRFDEAEKRSTTPSTSGIGAARRARQAR